MPAKVQKTLDMLSEKQPLWLVGGVALDFLSGKACREIDAVSGHSEAQLKSMGGLPIGGDFDTHTWKLADVILEVSPLRQATIVDDLAQRDFSLSSIAIVWPTGNVVDCNGGRRDRENGLVQAIYNALQNDPLRVLRAFRRMAEGYRFTATTAAQIAIAATRLLETEPTRIGRELEKILLGRCATATLCAMAKYPNLLAAIDPILPAASTIRSPGQFASIWRHSALLVGAMPAVAYWRWAAFFHDVGKLLPVVSGQPLRVNLSDHAERSASFADRKLMDWGIAKETRVRAVDLITDHTFRARELAHDAAALRLWLATTAAASDDLLQFCRCDRWAAGKIQTNDDLADLAAAIKACRKAGFPARASELAIDPQALFAELHVTGKQRGVLLDHLWRWALRDPQARNQMAALWDEARRFNAAQ